MKSTTCSVRILFASLAYGLAASDRVQPWPRVPSPVPHEHPDIAPFIEPISVQKGVTSKSKSGSYPNPLTFSAVGDVFTLDYGRDVAGKPRFVIASLDEPAQIEVRYTEAYDGLNNKQADGPFPFANALGATFRVETYNVTEPGDLNGYFIHGSQRWQSVRLIKGSNLNITAIGFTSSIDETPLNATLGYFASSNTSYSDIWALGPRTEKLCCFRPGTQSSTWDISDKGAYIRGQKPATTGHVSNLANYSLSFDTMIDYGGVGWRMDNQIDSIQASGPYFVLTSEYPDGSFVNTDTSLVPPNTLVLGRGWSLQNQTSLPGYVLDKFPIGFNITEKEWHTIRTDSPGDSTYVVYVDGHKIASFNISSYAAGHFGGTEPGGNPNSMIPGGYHRSFAFGPWQDQAAWVRNVTAISRATDKVLYENPMTSDEVLVEYGVQANEEYVCSDAGKRDRYSWLGDRIISSRVTMVSTGEEEFVWGPADQALSRQVSTGQIPINTLFSPLDIKSKLLRTSNIDPLLVDYNFDFLQVAYDYWLRSGNDTFLDIHWQGMVSVLNYAMSRALDPNTQLYGAPNGPKGLPLSGQKVMVNAPGTANTVSMILGLERLADIAEHLGQDDSAGLWRQQAQLSRDAIDRLLWNSTEGFYALNAGSADYDLMDIALALVGGIGTREKRVSIIKKLEALRVPAGYMNGTRFVDTPLVVDPYYLSFLLEGLAKENETQLAQDLLDRTWLPMVRQDANFTGAYWEYLNDDGTYPGLDLFSANSHFWGSYPTVFLTEYVLGVRPTKKGYSEFLFAPLPEFNTEWVHGRVPTPAGLIYAAWGYNSDGKIMMEITVPKGLKGKINPAFTGPYTINGKKATSESVVTGGQTVVIVQL